MVLAVTVEVRIMYGNGQVETVSLYDAYPITYQPDLDSLQVRTYFLLT